MASLPACLSSAPAVLVFQRRGTWVGRRRGAARKAVRPMMLDIAGAGGASGGGVERGCGWWVVVVVGDVEACTGGSTELWAKTQCQETKPRRAAYVITSRHCAGLVVLGWSTGGAGPRAGLPNAAVGAKARGAMQERLARACIASGIPGIMRITSPSRAPFKPSSYR